MLMIVRLLLVCATLTAVGCGQKGPLFLPGEPGEMRQVTPTTQPADDEEDGGSTGGQR